MPNTADKCFTRHKPAFNMNLIVLTVTIPIRELSENYTSAFSEYREMQNEILGGALVVISGYEFNPTETCFKFCRTRWHRGC